MSCHVRCVRSFLVPAGDAYLALQGPTASHPLVFFMSPFVCLYTHASLTPSRLSSGSPVHPFMISSLLPVVAASPSSLPPTCLRTRLSTLPYPRTRLNSTHTPPLPVSASDCRTRRRLPPLTSVAAVIAVNTGRGRILDRRTQSRAVHIAKDVSRPHAAHG